MIKVTPTTIFIIIILLMIGSLVYVINRNTKLKAELNDSEQNLTASLDTLHKTKNKVGELEYSKANYISKVGELETYSADLKTELDKVEGKVHYLNKILIKLEGGQETSVNDKVINYGGAIYGVQWDFIKEYNAENKRFLQGITKFEVNFTKGTINPISTMLLRDDIHFSVVSGIKEVSGTTSSFVTSPYEGFSVTNLESAIIRRNNNALDTRKPKNSLSVGLHGGYGLQYNLINDEIGHGPQIGVGLNYSISLF